MKHLWDQASYKMNSDDISQTLKMYRLILLLLDVCYYNTACDNTVLDITRFKDGSQKFIDYIEK